MTHDYDHCPAKVEIANFHRWQIEQNHTLQELTEGVQELCKGDAYRRGGRDMLKWILGFAGVSGLTGIAGLLINLFT